MAEEKTEQLQKSFSGKILGGLLRCTFFNKPIKNKLVHVEVGSIEAGLFPDEDEITALNEIIKAAVEADPEKFSNTAFLVTGPYVKFRSYSVEKLKKKMTMILLGTEDVVVEGDEFEKIKKEIVLKFEALKISANKLFITNWPIKVIREKKTDATASE